MDSGGNTARWSRLPNCSVFIHCSGNHFKVQCVHQRQTDWNKRKRSWLGFMWCCATVRLDWQDTRRHFSHLSSLLLLPMPVLFQGDPREAELCWEWFLVLESLTELLLPGPEAKVSIFSWGFRIFAACPQGSVSSPSCAVRSVSRASGWWSFCPTGAEAGRELLAGSEVGVIGTWHSKATVRAPFAGELENFHASCSNRSRGPLKWSPVCLP